MDICFLLFQHGYMYICFAIRDGQGNQQAHEFVSSFCWPKKWQTSGMTGRNVFEKRTSTSGDLKCSASELLSVYPVVRLMVLVNCPDYNNHQISSVVRSFLAGCHVLDLLTKTVSGQVTPAELEFAIKTHCQLRLLAHGPTKYQPKMHYVRHLSQQLASHPRLLSCFVHERKHKSLKKFANDSHNHNRTTAFEKGLLQEVVLLQATQLGGEESQISFGLKSPKKASNDLIRQIQMFFQLNVAKPLEVQCSLEAFLRPSELCAQNDVVIVKDQHGYEQVGQVWFHFQVYEDVFTVWSCWPPKPHSKNVFVVTDSPDILKTSRIQRCLVYRFQNDMKEALVVP